MYRFAPSLLLGFSITFTALSAPVPNAKDGGKNSSVIEEIKKAIDDLGSKRFAVRDKAKKYLLEAGETAEPYLEEAARSPDEEIASSAKAILERFQWGLYPNTPQAVRDLIEQFRSGTPEERQEAIGNLLKLKEVPLATLRRLIAREENVELREQMQARMYQQARATFPRLLARGDHAAMEGIFELVINRSPTLFGQDYAVFMYLRGKLDEPIARFEKLKDKKNEEGQRAAEMLVYLYRCKGNWQAARVAAEKSGKDELVERVLWQSYDWKGLAAISRPPEIGKSIWAGAAYDRLAGNRKGYEEKIEAIIKAAKDETEDWVGLRLEANALMLNGKANEAIEILAEKKRELGLTFDLLGAQMRHKEAFELVDEARRRDTDPKERVDIQIRRARMLYLLGEKDAAKQLFNSVAKEVAKPEDFEIARNLIKAETRVGGGLADMAAEHAGQCIAALGKVNNREAIGRILEPLFGDDKSVAQTWWTLMRKEQPDEKPEVAMKRVEQILAGKLERKQLDDWLATMEKQTGKEEALPGSPVMSAVLYRARCLEAQAAACRAAGDDKKAEEFLTKAAEKAKSVDRWIKLGDFLMSKKLYKKAANAYAKASNRLDPLDAEIEVDEESQLSEEPTPALAVYMQARATTLAGDAEEGKRLAAIAHWLPLGDDAARAELVEGLNKRDWPEMARLEADMLLKTGWWSDYVYGNVLSFLARQAAREKNYLAAADYYEKCLVGCLRNPRASFIEPTAYLLVPESVRVYRARGLLAKGEIDEALREANANLAVMPGNIDLAIKMVPDLDRLGRKKEAKAIYENVRDAWVKLTKDYPESAYAHNSAAWVMANCHRDLDDALKHAEKAVKLEPKSPGYLDTLAEVTFRRGDRDKALALMTKCAELDPKSGYFRRQLVRFKSQPLDSPTPDESEDEE